MKVKVDPRVDLVPEPSSEVLGHISNLTTLGPWQPMRNPKTISGPPPLLPVDTAERKRIPIASGVLDYFPSALIEVAKVSFLGNEQHNPGEPLHWARGKSMDQADSLLDHFVERGTFDHDGVRHSAKMAWRALALLQLECEADGAPMARNAK